jgi:TonB family protein
MLNGQSGGRDTASAQWPWLAPAAADPCWHRTIVRRKLLCMRRRFLPLVLCVVGVSLFAGSAQTQSPAVSQPAQGGVFLTKVYDPVYPRIAHVANVSGDVELMLQVGQDGTVQSVEVVSGPPLLQRAAVESARQSQFECRACSDAVTPYRLVYSFQLSSGDCCNSADSPKVSQAGNHVWVTNSQFCFCDPGATRKARSLKCLYLWRCSDR